MTHPHPMIIPKKDFRKKLPLTTHIELFSQTIDELEILFEDHYKAISAHKNHSIPLQPDYAKYYQREINGELLFIALRSNGRLVGYFTGFIGTALHYRSCLQCQLDLIYISRIALGQKAGHLLVEAVKRECVRRGVRLLTMGFKEHRKRFMPKLLSECGLVPFETHYCMWFE